MKALFVYERLEFERGLNPKSAVGIGMEDALKRAMEEDGRKHYDDHLSLEWAAGQGRKDFVEYLIKKGADPNNSQALTRATNANDIEIYKLLLDAGAKMSEIEKRFEGPRNIIKNSEDTSQLEYLISRGLDLEEIGKTMLTYAVEKPTADWVKVLLDNGLDVSDVNLFNINLSRKAGKYLLDHMSKLAAEQHP